MSAFLYVFEMSPAPRAHWYFAPGTATVWTATTYPFTQDTAPVGGLEPLLLPWGGAQAVRYRWSNGAFSR